MTVEQLALLLDPSVKQKSKSKINHLLSNLNRLARLSLTLNLKSTKLWSWIVFCLLAVIHVIQTYRWEGGGVGSKIKQRAENILLTASNSSATNISTLMIKDQWLTNVCIPLLLPTLNAFLPKIFPLPSLLNPSLPSSPRLPTCPLHWKANHNLLHCQAAVDKYCLVN